MNISPSTEVLFFFSSYNFGILFCDERAVFSFLCGPWYPIKSSMQLKNNKGNGLNQFWFFCNQFVQFLLIQYI